MDHKAKEFFETHLKPESAVEKLTEWYLSLSPASYRAKIKNALSETGTKLTERQIAWLIGYKDEFFVQGLAQAIIEEKGLTAEWSAEKVTKSDDPRMAIRKIVEPTIAKEIESRREPAVMYTGGDLVLFHRKTPRLIVECKEYIDTIRLKELIGEAYLWKADPIDGGVERIAPQIPIVVFANVWELRETWRVMVLKYNFRGHIDDFFIIKPGKKRKDKDARPDPAEITRFEKYLRSVILNP